MSDPDNTRPPLTTDLEKCDVCRQPATSWADGPVGSAVGVCSEACRAWVALAVETQEKFGPPPTEFALHRCPVLCPFCQRSVTTRDDGTIVPHNDKNNPLVPHPSMAGVLVANRCPGTGCTPRGN